MNEARRSPTVRTSGRAMFSHTRRVAALVGVKDEVELIGHCLEHLRRIGVKTIIVVDMSSRDGTREFLGREDDNNLRVIDVPADISNDDWLQVMRDLVRSCDAEWVMQIDADEFPLPLGGDITTVLAGVEADVLTVPRYNVVLGPGGVRMPLPPMPETYGRTDLYVKPDPELRTQLAVDPTRFWLPFVPNPKVIVRPELDLELRLGGHGVVAPPNVAIRRETAGGLLIAHVALSDYARFHRKASNIRETFRVMKGDVPLNFAWHWRRWAEMADRGELWDEFTRSHLSEADIARQRTAGVIRSAAEVLGPQYSLG
jgi:hypothetical protein